MTGPVQQQIQQLTDVGGGLALMSAPMWLRGAETWIAFAVAVMGAILIGLRIYISWQHIKLNRKKLEGSNGA